MCCFSLYFRLLISLWRQNGFVDALSREYDTNGYFENEIEISIYELLEVHIAILYRGPNEKRINKNVHTAFCVFFRWQIIYMLCYIDG